MAGVGLLGFQVSASLLNYFNLIIQQRLSKIVEIGMMAQLIRHLLTLSISYLRQTEPERHRGRPFASM